MNNPWYIAGVVLGLLDLLALWLGAEIYGTEYISRYMWIHSIILAISVAWGWMVRPIKK